MSPADPAKNGNRQESLPGEAEGKETEGEVARERLQRFRRFACTRKIGGAVRVKRRCRRQNDEKRHQIGEDDPDARIDTHPQRFVVSAWPLAAGGSSPGASPRTPAPPAR